MLLKLSDLNSNLALTLGYLNPALNNSALETTWFTVNLVPRFLSYFSLQSERGTRDEGRVEENSENEVGIPYGTKKRREVVKSRCHGSKISGSQQSLVLKNGRKNEKN